MVLSVLLFPMNLAGRIQQTSKDYSKDARIILWKNTVQVIEQNIFFGVGSGKAFLDQNISDRIGDGRAQFAHNSYIQSAANWGLPAGVLFTLIIISTMFGLLSRISKINKIRMHKFRPLFLSLTACLIAFSVAIIFVSREGQKDLFFIIFMCWALMNIDDQSKIKGLSTADPLFAKRNFKTNMTR